MDARGLSARDRAFLRESYSVRKKKEKKEKNVARDKEEELLGGGKNGRISIFQRGEKNGER